MEIIDEYTDDDLAYWADLDPHPVTFHAPQGLSGCAAANAIVTRSNGQGDMAEASVVRVGWKPNEEDLAQLAEGGTIWLSTWGGLPPHMLEIAPPTGHTARTDARPT
jgi:hypothetical protein